MRGGGPMSNGNSLKFSILLKSSLIEAYVSILNQVCQIVGFFDNALLDINYISAYFFNYVLCTCDFVRFPTISGGRVSGNYRHLGS